MQTLLKIVLLATFVANASSAVLRVPEDFGDIQSAIDAAIAGDVVDVAPGVYTLTVVDTAEPTLQTGPIKVRGQRVLPLKVQLLDATGQPRTDADLSSPPVVQVLFTAPDGEEAIDITDEALPAGLGDEGNQFVFSEGRWRFNLKTKPYSAPGLYSIQLVSGDPSEYGVVSCQIVFLVE